MVYHVSFRDGLLKNVENILETGAWPLHKFVVVCSWMHWMLRWPLRAITMMGKHA